MSKAELRALETYPMDGEVDCYPISRAGYIAGYHQAEKDFALTVEDISKIISIDQQVCSEYGISKYVVEHKEAMKEVLKRFLESK